VTSTAVPREHRRRRALRLLVIGLLAGAPLGCASSGAGGGGQAPGEAEANPRAARPPRVEADDGHVLVVLRSTLDRPTSQIVERLALRFRLTPRAAWPMKSLERECVVFDVLGGRVDDSLLRRIEGDPAVEIAQLNSTFEVRAQPGQPAQLALRVQPAQPAQPASDPHSDLQYSRRVLNLDAAHRRATGRGVRVAIVDTGADFDHPELRGQVAEAKTFVGGNDGFTSDRHGTAIAGVIGAARGNGVGIVGVAPGSRLHLLKACWYPRRRAARSAPDGDEARAVCSSYTLALALDHAVDSRYDVVNLSLGGPQDPLLERIVAAGIERDMVFVAPAAERPDDGFLEGLPEVLRVAALDGEGTPAPTVAPGVAAPEGSRVLGAPGVEVLTTVPGGGFDFIGGSSIASAHVAGVVALLLEPGAKRPAAGGSRARGVGDLLLSTSQPASAGAPAAVDACSALAAALGAREPGAAADRENDCGPAEASAARRPTSPSQRPDSDRPLP